MKMNNLTFHDAESNASENHYEVATHLDSSISAVTSERSLTPSEKSMKKRLNRGRSKLLIFSALALVLIFGAGLIFFGITHTVTLEHKLDSQKSSLGALALKLTSCVNETTAAVENERALLLTCQNVTETLEKQSEEQMLMILHQNRQIRLREQNISDLYAEVQEYKNLTANLKKEISTYQETLLQKKADLDTKEAAIAMHQKYIKAVESSDEPKNVQLAKQKAELETHLLRIQNQSWEISNLTAGLDAEKAKVLEHLRLNNDSRVENERLLAENLKQKQQIDTHFEQLKLQNALIETHMSRVKVLEVEVLSKTNTSTHQQTKIELLESIITKYTAESAEKTEQIKTLTEKVNTKRSRVSELETENATLKARKTVLEADIQAKREEISRLERTRCSSYGSYGYYG